MRSEIENDENFESQVKNASDLRDIDSLITKYEDRHERIENEHGNIESKTSFLENALKDAEEQGINTQAVVAARTNVSVLENTVTKTEEELLNIDNKLEELDDAVRSREIGLDRAKGKLYSILEHEGEFIEKVESQIENKWMNQYS